MVISYEATTAVELKVESFTNTFFTFCWTLLSPTHLCCTRATLPTRNTGQSSTSESSWRRNSSGTTVVVGRLVDKGHIFVRFHFATSQ